MGDDSVTGNILGYDLNEKNCQISFYSEEQQEPQTMEIVADNYQIPLVLGRKGDVWSFGNDAKRLGVSREGYTVSNLFVKSLLREKVSLGEETYEAVWLLAKFIELSLEKFEQIQQLVFTVPRMSVDIGKILKGIGQRIGVAKSNIYVQDYKESFCNYMLYQPKELWHYEAALFHCDRYEVRAYMLRKLRTGIGKGADTFVTVDQVASAQMKELAAVYPVLNVDRAKAADNRFKQFVQSVFDKKLVSSVFLTGEGFENNWYPLSLKVLCNGRRAFLGNNLYSKGACYTAYRRSLDYKEGPIYLDDTKMTEQICLKMRINGQDEWYPVVPWGTRWYESDMQFEVLLEEVEDIEIHIESLTGNEMRVETVSMEELPKRKDYALRLQVKTLFLDEKTCKISFKDIGFGEFFPATDFYEEKEIHLGGNDGQFNSLL
ncbi:DUF5716 family protein [Faecalimonas sp. LCP19S3_D12]